MSKAGVKGVKQRLVFEFLIGARAYEDRIFNKMLVFRVEMGIILKT